MAFRWKKQAQPHNNHLDDWLMTYADMITLLLCFFVIGVPTYIVSHRAHQATLSAAPSASIPAHEVNPSIRFANLALPFPNQEPDPDQPQAVAPVTSPTTTIVPPPDPEPAPMPIAKTEEPAPPPLVAQNTPAAPEAKKDELPTQDVAEVAAASVPPMEEAAPESIADLVTRVRLDLAGNLKPTVIPASSTDDKTDRLTALDIGSSAFFDAGSAALKPEGRKVLLDIAATLKAPKYKDYKITVEGHTDDTPIKTAEFPSNWELSTARASAVVHYLLAQNIPAQKMRAAGYADSLPKAPNSDDAGHPIPQNQALNRRVTIRLEKVDPSTFATLSASRNPT